MFKVLYQLIEHLQAIEKLNNTLDSNEEESQSESEEEESCNESEEEEIRKESEEEEGHASEEIDETEISLNEPSKSDSMSNFTAVKYCTVIEVYYLKQL